MKRKSLSKLFCQRSICECDKPHTFRYPIQSIEEDKLRLNGTPTPVFMVISRLRAPHFSHDVRWEGGTEKCVKFSRIIYHFWAGPRGVSRYRSETSGVSCWYNRRTNWFYDTHLQTKGAVKWSFKLLFTAPRQTFRWWGKKCSINFVSGKVPFFREWWKKDKSENDCHRTPQAGTTTTEKFLCLFLSRSRACLKLIQFILILPHTARLKNKHNRVELILVFFSSTVAKHFIYHHRNGEREKFFLFMPSSTMKYHDRIINDL